jgi:hypothetical protein
MWLAGKKVVCAVELHLKALGAGHHIVNLAFIKKVRVTHRSTQGPQRSEYIYLR